MPTNFNAVDAECPFYVEDDGRQRIRCEGIVPDTTATLWFRTQQGYRRHLETYCCGRYAYCERYMALMEKYKEESMEQSKVYSRQELAALMGVDDRTMRAEIRKQRRMGVPIMALKTGGYKMAETDEEKLELLKMYRNRALDELVTYNRLRKMMQVEGQISVMDLAEMVDIAEDGPCE